LSKHKGKDEELNIGGEPMRKSKLLGRILAIAFVLALTGVAFGGLGVASPALDISETPLDGMDAVTDHTMNSDFPKTLADEAEFPNETIVTASITAYIDAWLLDLIDARAPLFFDSAWNMNINQFKAWLATIAWAEGGPGGYVAHSQYGGGYTGDCFNHIVALSSFRFSTGIGPFQLDRGGGAENWHLWRTDQKLNPQLAVDSTARWHRDNRGSGSTLSGFAINSPWVAVRTPADYWSAVTGTSWSAHSGGAAYLDWTAIKSELASRATSYPHLTYSSNVVDVGYLTWNIKAEANLQTESGRSVIFDGAYQTFLITARTWGGSQVCKYYYTYRTDGPFPVEVWVWDNNWDTSNKFKYIFARECNGQYPEWRVAGTSTAGYPTLSQPAIIDSGPPAYPEPTISASEYQTEIDVGETDWVEFTVRNDGTEYTPSWGLQVRVNDGLELVQHSSYPWNQGNMCSSDAVEWWKENDLVVGASDYILVGIKGKTTGPWVVKYTAWMYDPDGQPQSVQYSHTVRSVPCDRDYAQYGVTVTCPTPGTPSLVSPGNGESGVSTTPILDWSDVSGATSYDVQVCSDSGCTSVVRSANDVGSSQWTVVPELSTGTQYWWRARAKNSCGPGSWSSIWSFTTQGNTPPNMPSNPSPSNHAAGIPINADFSWTGGDPDVGDTVTYDVYCGTSSSPPLVSNDQPGTTYDPGTLTYSTKYYWKLVATDNRGASTPGPLWDFTTESAGPGEWKSPSATGDQFNEWISPANAYSSNNQYADCGLAEPQHAYQDYCNFGFSIPSNAIIQGIEVRCEGHTTHTEGNWWISRLSGDGGSTWSADRYSPDVNLNTDTTVYIGGSSDLWGKSWTPSNFSNANFRLLILPLYLVWTEDPHHLDHIQVKVYYTDEPCPTPGIPSNPSPINLATDVSVNADLDWSDCSDTDYYDVHFGTSSPPPYYGGASESNAFLPTLDYDTHYYWQIVARNNCGNSATGPLWDFTTESAGPGEWKSPSATGDQFSEWINPTNAYSSDNQYADCGLDEPQHAYQDYCNFDFSIPSNVIIQGIEVRCEGHTTDTGQMWWISRLSGDGGSTWSTDRYSPDVNLNTDTTVYIGGSSDLWGKSWTPSSFSNANFRLLIFPLSLPWPPTDAHHLDHIQVKVYYTINNPPNTPSDPSPPNRQPGVPIDADLSWSGGDPDPGDTVSYDVYFGTSSSPPLVSNDQPGTTYDPGTLAYGTKYYWKVVAIDNHGATTEAPLWDFTTGDGCEADISVVLQGGSRPPEGWEVPITIKFFNPGSDVPLYVFNLTTIKSDGIATCQCVGVMPGTYDMTARASNCPECTEGNCTLTNVKRSVVISSPSTAVDMGTLLAGDANCDGIINISDFGILAVSYMCTEGEPCYDCRVDFDCNGIINISDFGLLAVNYMEMSPIDISA
jgi:hypothetical protein